MIEIIQATKKFGKLVAVDNIDFAINDGMILGVVGSNGAGKSTLLRLISGVYSLNEGNIIVDDMEVFDNPSAKKNFVFLSDTPNIEFSTTLKSLSKEYAIHYQDFSFDEFNQLCKHFTLDVDTPISNLSKGMKRQAMIILALSCKCKYLVLDETLDGLDPVIRGVVKKKIYDSVLREKTTVIISSHSLKELEDFCDSIVMIHKGKMIFQRTVEDMQTLLFKVQVAFSKEYNSSIFDKLNVIKYSKNGSVSNLIVKGDKDEIISELELLSPILLEAVPLSLEEIFTYELKERGYTIDDIIENEMEKQNEKKQII